MLGPGLFQCLYCPRSLEGHRDEEKGTGVTWAEIGSRSLGDRLPGPSISVFYPPQLTGPPDADRVGDRPQFSFSFSTTQNSD